jgi:hypothetical protein
MITEAELIGAWNAAGQDRLGPDGRVTGAVGAGAPGRIIYTAEHQLMVISITSDDLARAPAEQLDEAARAAIASACTAYAGRWELVGERLLHHIDIAIFPAWMGTTRVRFPSLAGDLLTLTTLPEADGSVTRIYWRRAAG